jgi:hypothetical protein
MPCLLALATRLPSHQARGSTCRHGGRRRPSESPWVVRHVRLHQARAHNHSSVARERLACGGHGQTRGSAGVQAGRVATRRHARVAATACRVAHAARRRHPNGLRHGHWRARHPTVRTGVRRRCGGARSHHRLGGAASGRAGARRARHVPLEARGDVCACCLQLRPKAACGSCIDEGTHELETRDVDGWEAWRRDPVGRSSRPCRRRPLASTLPMNLPDQSVPP